MHLPLTPSIWFWLHHIAHYFWLWHPEREGGGRGEGGGIGSIFAGCVLLASQKLPILSTLWPVEDPILVTFGNSDNFLTANHRNFKSLLTRTFLTPKSQRCATHSNNSIEKKNQDKADRDPYLVSLNWNWKRALNITSKKVATRACMQIKYLYLKQQKYFTLLDN